MNDVFQIHKIWDRFMYRDIIRDTKHALMKKLLCSSIPSWYFLREILGNQVSPVFWLRDGWDKDCEILYMVRWICWVS